jgi:hypothetical protein
MNATIEQTAARVPQQRCCQGPLDAELECLWEDRDQSGKCYDLYLGRISRNPVVRSLATGKYFMLPWSEIIDLALRHGIADK